jgi:hypothetical protein
MKKVSSPVSKELQESTIPALDSAAGPRTTAFVSFIVVVLAVLTIIADMPSTKQASPTKTAASSYRSLRRRQFERRHSKAKMRP